MDRLRARARKLRKNPTNAERLLWQKLRYWQMDGCKFRRQQPLGHYIVDFVCLQKRLIIEIDGGQQAQRREYDKERDAWLRAQGFVVLRVWNNDAMQNIEGVMQKIAEHLKSTPFRGPCPQGGRMSIKKTRHSTQLNH